MCVCWPLSCQSNATISWLIIYNFWKASFTNVRTFNVFTFIFLLEILIKLSIKKYHKLGTVPRSKRKVLEQGIKTLDFSTSVKSDRFKLVL